MSEVTRLPGLRRLLPLAASALLACAAGAGEPPPKGAPDRPCCADCSATGHHGAAPYFAHARFEAVTNVSGEPAGVRVLSVAKGGRVSRLGLRGGDLMLRISGQSLTDKATFDQAVAIAERAFLGAEKVTVKLLRDGETFSLAELGAAQVGPPAPKAPGEAGQPPPPKP